jgi:WD40 repeat protein
MIASSDKSGYVRLWNLQGGLIDTFQVHQAFQIPSSERPKLEPTQVLSIAFSPDGQRIVCGLDDGTIQTLNWQDHEIGSPIDTGDNQVWSVAFNPDGQLIATGGVEGVDGTIRLWDLQGHQIGRTFAGHIGRVWSVAFSPDGKSIVSGGNDRTVRLWDLEGNLIDQPFQGHLDAVTWVTFSPDSHTIASASADRTVRLWQADWESWMQVACNRLQNHPIWQDPDSSFDPRVVREARATCEQEVWSHERLAQLTPFQMPFAMNLRETFAYLSDLWHSDQ